MPKDLFCLPTAKTAVPAGPDWIHEVKYDGYRLRVERKGDRVRLLSKSGHDWTKRDPWIVETARKIRKKQFILDGEAVVLGVDGLSNYNDLHSRQYDEEVQLYAFDILAYEGDDLTRLPLHLRPAAARPAERYLRCSLRAGRDRTVAVRGGLQEKAGGNRLQAPRAPLPRRPERSLAQGQEPEASGLHPRGESF